MTKGFWLSFPISTCLYIQITRINPLAYASEIAFVVCAKIAEGVVGMVEMVLVRLSEKGILLLEYNKKATKVSNLMVVLCAGKAADEF